MSEPAIKSSSRGLSCHPSTSRTCHAPNCSACPYSLHTPRLRAGNPANGILGFSLATSKTLTCSADSLVSCEKKLTCERSHVCMRVHTISSKQRHLLMPGLQLCQWVPTPIKLLLLLHTVNDLPRATLNKNHVCSCVSFSAKHAVST